MILENNSTPQTPSLAEYKHLMLKNERTDILTPTQAINNITLIVCTMLEENIAYASKNGLTEKAQLSRERLLKLLDATELFNTIQSQNAGLKLTNRQLIAEAIEVKRQENMAKSI